MLGLRFFLLLALTLALYLSEQHSDFCRQLRAHLSILALPVQKMVDAPIRLVSWTNSTMTTHQHLLMENADLRSQQLIVEAKLQRLVSLQKENEDLRKLLNSTAKLSTQSTVAQLLAVDLDPSVQQVILNKGEKQKVYEGQPVLDAYGVVGQIVTVGPYTSRILLISDQRSAVPVQDGRSGVRAIAVGSGSSQLLTLLHVPDTADIQEGDVLVSSGLGQRFPAGYPVGTVIQVKKISAEPFVSITVMPKARLDRTEQVLLMWPEKAAHDAEVQQQLNYKKIGGKLPA